MGVYRRSRTHKGRKEKYKKYRLRRRTKDMQAIFQIKLEVNLDQIVEDLEKGSQTRDYDVDLPGGGQFECVSCSKLFISKTVMEDHLKTKSHKKRIKELKVKPYTLEEAYAAGGSGTNDFYGSFQMKVQ